MPITPKQFAENMQYIKDKYKYETDLEYAHLEMDAAMCQLLRELGYEEGVDIFKKTEKWYS